MADPVNVTETTILVLCDIALVLIFVVGVVANSLVLLVFYRKPGLRTVSNRFVINLVATNLAACFVELPLVLLDNLLGPTGHVRTWLCAADEGVTAAVCSASVLAVLLIALDQYWAVVDPLRYHARIGAARSAGMIVSAWLVALVFGVCGGINLTSGPKPSLWYSCGNSTDPLDLTTSSNLYPTLFAVIFSICIFLLPFGAILWIYICIYTAAHRNSQRTRRRGSAAMGSTNLERQYFPVAVGRSDLERNKLALRRDTVNLQRSQTFAEGNVKPRSPRKSSEGDISYHPIEIRVSGVNSEVVDSSKSPDRQCSMEFQDNIDETNKTVSYNLVVEVPASISDDNPNSLGNYAHSSSLRKTIAATFCLGPPEIDSKHEPQVVLIVDEKQAVQSETESPAPGCQLKRESKCISPIAIQPLSKQAFSASATQIQVQTACNVEEHSPPIPKNTESKDVASKAEEINDLHGARLVRPFSSLIKGIPHSNSMPTVTITPPQVVTTRTSLSQNSSLRGSGNIVTSLRSRISNASLFRYREEMRAARISALVIIMALANWLPYCALILLYSNVLNVSLDIPHYVDALGLLLLSSGALISPCLFAYRNRKLQREVKKVLGFTKTRKENGSSRREDQCRGETNLSSDGIKKILKKSPLVNAKNCTNITPVRKLWEWGRWKQIPGRESRFIGSNLLQHNATNMGCGAAKDAGLLLSCMKGSRWVRQEGTCDLNTLHNSALRTSVDTCRSSFSSGGSTNSTQCTSSSLETAVDN